MKFYLKTIFSVLAFVTHSIAKSVNSGCFSGNKKIDVFCQYVGCSQQPFHGQYDEPIIIRYNNHTKEKINFVCSSQTQSNIGDVVNYNIVSSSEENDFLVPTATSDVQQYWFSPPLNTTLGSLNITFNNLEALGTNNHIVIVRKDLSVYCEIFTSHLINSHTYTIVTESYTQTYMVRISVNIDDKNEYSRCPTPENPSCGNCHKIHIQNHTFANFPYHIRQSPRHILLADNGALLYRTGKVNIE